jgi:hypothetical protein
MKNRVLFRIQRILFFTMSFPCPSFFVKAFSETVNAARYINDLSNAAIFRRV